MLTSFTMYQLFSFI